MSNEQVTSENVFAVGEAVTYRYGSRKIHAKVDRISKTGQRVRIGFKGNPNATWVERVYVMPKNLERGHV